MKCSRKFEQLFFLETVLLIACMNQKKTFPVHSQRHYRYYQPPDAYLFFSLPIESYMFAQTECFSDITGNYWNGLQKPDLRRKKRREKHQLQIFSNWLSSKTFIKNLFNEKYSCCITSGQKGSERIKCDKSHGSCSRSLQAENTFVKCKASARLEACWGCACLYYSSSPWRCTLSFHGDDT